MWRACHSVIPTAMSLAAKQVPIQTRCSWCLNQEEDIAHVLFRCSFAREVWARVDMQEIQLVRCQEPIQEIFQKLFNICTRENIIWIAVVCWGLWHRRNRWVWDRIMGSEFGVYSAVVNLVHD